MKDLNVLQGTDEWLAVRAIYPRTGSIAPAMMGVCKSIKRNELLHMKATGTEQEFSDWVRKHILDKGHEYEALARPIAEEIVSEELYPVTVATDDDYLMASLDGMTMLGNVIFEHKQPNAELMAEVRAGRCPDYHYWQVVQGLAITGAEKCLFMVSDGTKENCAWCWVERNDSDCAKLIAAWKQFDSDLAAYQPAEVIPAAVAAPIKDLPAVIYKLNGTALTSNLADYKARALELVEDSKKPMETDQDFADRIELCKKFGEAEKKIELMQAQVVGEIHDVNAFCTDLGEISKMFRTARLAGEKLVEAEKANRRNAIIAGAKEKWQEHIAGLNKRLGKPYMPEIPADFALAMKGLKSLSSMQNAVDTLLANAKLTANEACDKIDANLKTLRELAADYAFLFSDTPQLVGKANDDLTAIIKSRIAEHVEAKRKEEEATRERIRAEEQARAESEARAKIEREQAEAKAKADAEAAKNLDQEARTDKATVSSNGASSTPGLSTFLPAEAVAPEPAPSAVLPATGAASVSMLEQRKAIADSNDDGTKLTLGEVNAQLGFTVTAEFLASLGFAFIPAHKGNGKLYRNCDFIFICDAIAAHCLRVGGLTANRRAAA